MSTHNQLPFFVPFISFLPVFSYIVSLLFTLPILRMEQRVIMSKNALKDKISCAFRDSIRNKGSKRRIPASRPIKTTTINTAVAPNTITTAITTPISSAPMEQKINTQNASIVIPMVVPKEKPKQPQHIHHLQQSTMVLAAAASSTSTSDMIQPLLPPTYVGKLNQEPDTDHHNMSTERINLMGILNQYIVLTSQRANSVDTSSVSK
jgi:hypothetical protein